MVNFRVKRSELTEGGIKGGFSVPKSLSISLQGEFIFKVNPLQKGEVSVP
jgi:hypothetical protein